MISKLSRKTFILSVFKQPPQKKKIIKIALLQIPPRVNMYRHIIDKNAQLFLRSGSTLSAKWLNSFHKMFHF